MSPTHKVRRIFLITCCFTVILFIGLSWRFLSHRDVLHFSQPNSDHETPVRHPKLKPTLKIFAQALKHAPLQRELPEQQTQTQSRRTDSSDGEPSTGSKSFQRNEAPQEPNRDLESFHRNEAPHGRDKDPNIDSQRKEAPQGGERDDNTDFEQRNEAPQGADRDHNADFEFSQRKDVPHRLIPRPEDTARERLNSVQEANKISENGSPDIDGAANSQDLDRDRKLPLHSSAKNPSNVVIKSENKMQNLNPAKEVKTAEDNDSRAPSQSRREGLQDNRQSQDKTNLSQEEEEPAEDDEEDDPGWNEAVESNMIPDDEENTTQNKADTFNLVDKLRLEQGEKRNSVVRDNNVQDTDSEANNNEIRSRFDQNPEQNSVLLRSKLDQQRKNLNQPAGQLKSNQFSGQINSNHPMGQLKSNARSEQLYSNQRAAQSNSNRPTQQPDLNQPAELFSSNNKMRNRIQDPRKTMNSVSMDSGNPDNRFPNFGRLVKGRRKKLLGRGDARSMDVVQSKSEASASQNVSAHNEHFRQMIEQMEKAKQAEAERQRADTVKTDFKADTSKKDFQPERQRGSPVKSMSRTELKPDAAKADDSGSGVDKFGDRKDSCAHCFHSNFPILIDHPSYCRQFSSSTLVLLLISSAPMNQDQRQAIRSTWGGKCQDPTSSYRCLFVLGDSQSAQVNDLIRKENEEFKDILQFGFKDAYSNLTYKTLTSLHWVSTRCGQVSYAMKTDDDMYVNTELIPTLLTATPRQDFMGGFCWGNSSPNRDMQSKWYVPLRSFRHSSFPPMCSGTGYIMSSDVVRKVLAASEDIPFFHLEDVYVALCLQKYNIRPRRIMGFHNTYVNFEPCQYHHKVMTSHEVPSYMLGQYWKEAQQCPGTPPSGSQLFVELPYPPT